MKIAMIGQKGYPAKSGGIERHVEELSKRLVKQGHDVSVFCRSWYCDASLENHEVKRMFSHGIKSKHFDAITHTFTAILKASRMKVDVFHIHGVGPSLLAWLPKLIRPSAKVVVTFHCIDRHHEKWNLFARVMLYLGEYIANKAPDVTISVSRTLSEYCHFAYGNKTIYIPNGTPIRQNMADETLLSPFGLEPNNYLMMCARLVRHKGQHVLINAWKQLKKEQPELVGDKKLAIVGGPAFTDDYVAELQMAAKEDDSIVLTGTQTGEVLNTLFTESYAVVHASRSEGLPIAILEAMSYGKCVLSSNIPENLEITKRHGLAFETDDINDLIQKLAALIEQPELVKQVGLAARAHVAKEYDWDDIANTTSELYEFLWYEPELQEVTIGG